MDTFQTIRRNRRLVWAGVAFDLVGLAINNLIRDEVGWETLTNLLFLTPAVLAIISLDRRPTLLRVAWMSAIFFAPFGFIGSGLVPAVLWGIADRGRPIPSRGPRWLDWARPPIALGMLIPLALATLHQDARCVSIVDGVRVVDDSPAGFAGGWGWQGSSLSITMVSSAESSSCYSNVVRGWEALIAMVAATGILWLIVQRWPRADSGLGISAREAMIAT